MKHDRSSLTLDDTRIETDPYLGADGRNKASSDTQF